MDMIQCLFDVVKKFIPASAVYRPDMEKHKKYTPYYRTFKKIYSANKSLYRAVAK